MLARMSSGLGFRRAGLPAVIFAVCAGVYVATLGPRALTPSNNAHFVHLADSYLHGTLAVVGNTPPGQNDWAKYEGRWYVSFPPLPAVIILPAVAIFGTGVWDRLFWAIFAGLGPALLFVLLRYLRESGRSQRQARDDLLLTGLFAFGTAYYYTSVQGTVWFAAHVVSVPLTAAFLLFALGARHPVLAGAALGLSFMARTSTLFLAPFFLVEALAASRRPETRTGGAADSRGLVAWLRGADWPAVVRRCLWFSLPVLAVGCVAMWLNLARFDDPFEFGHSHLQIRWRQRIERWGLFNYHYLSKNLAIFLAALPWLSAKAPYLMIGRHGLAIWVTTPPYLWLLWPRHKHATLIGLALSAGLVALLDLCYQNSGWVQFGYRFSNDYAVALFALLALGGQPFGKLFRTLCVVAVVVNLFGAITFDRMHRFYDRDLSQRVVFQPD